MPNSPINSTLSADSLRNYLANVLPDSQLTVEPVDAVHQPLVLLRMKHAMAGFAFTNGDMQQSYDHAYKRFKSYFTERRGLLDALDLSFVFCVQPGAVNLDEFCSSVETDVYFCRKFVVPLALPFRASLSRLPFLPLTPLDGKTLRPASAQTFLNRCGVPAPLAKFVVVQRERGAERIVEDCVNGEFGDPKELTSATNNQTLQPEVNTESVRLETVTIKNFRAYRKPQTFAIGTEVTILYGPNGFGKTSFFDAIDFAATGGIGRIASSSEAHFTKTAQHLDTGSEESAVSLSFQRGDSVRKITRNVKTRKEPHLDGRIADRKDVLAELTGREIVASDRVENFINLFRAMHLFNLEQQELTKDFHNDCSLPPEIVSRMLAFQDYSNAVSKANKIREIIESVVALAEKEIKELTEKIEVEKVELARLSKTTTANSEATILDADFDALQTRLIAAGFNPESGRPDAAIMRGWRASIEARHSESKNRSDRLSALVTEGISLPKMSADLTNAQLQIAEKEEALSTTEKKQTAAEVALQQIEKRLTEANAKCAEAQARATLLEWVRVTKPAYALATRNLTATKDELILLTGSVTQLRTAEEKAASNLHDQESLSIQTTDKLKSKRVDLATYQSLLESMKSWLLDRSRLASVVELEHKVQAALESLRFEDREISLQLAAIIAEEKRLERQIAEVDKGQSELKTLLSQLQGHIRTGTCPLCGEDHGSKDELIRRIQTFLTADAASIARNDLITVRAKIKQLAESVAVNEQKLQSCDAQLAALKEERANLDAKTGQFVTAATTLGIDMELADASPGEQIQSRLDLIQQEIVVLSQQDREVLLVLDEARTVFATAKSLVAVRVIELNDRAAILARQQEEIDRLLNDPRVNQISLTIDDETLANDERTNFDQLTEFKNTVTKLFAELSQAKTVIETLRQESASVKTELQKLRTQVANFQKAVTQIIARLEESKLPKDIDNDALLLLIAHEARLQEQLLGLRDSTSNLEMALDAATTAAALTTLQQNIRNKEKAIKASEVKRQQHLPWLTYFSKLSRLVSSQQNEAIANFTSEYGPRTSVIQRRLRSVYCSGPQKLDRQLDNSFLFKGGFCHGQEQVAIGCIVQGQGCVGIPS